MHLSYAILPIFLIVNPISYRESKNSLKSCKYEQKTTH